MQNPFIENPNMRISQLFSKSLNHFRTQTTVLIVYSVIKIVASIVLSLLTLSQDCPWALIDYWLALVGLQSLVNLWCYFAIQKLLKNLNVIIKIAEDLVQIIYIPLDENTIIPLNEDDLVCSPELDPQMNLNNQEENKKISILAMQIKYEASKKNAYIKWIGQISFIFNQILIILGFVIEFSLSDDAVSNPTQECKGPTLIFMFIFLILSIYQYIDLYVIMVLVLICLPFVLIYLGYQMIKQCQQQRKNQNFALKLEKSKIQYVPGVVEGDAECRICMSNYNLKENVIILPCNTMHHFHSNCITTWLKVSSSCPLCRQNFGGDAVAEAPLQQQLINHGDDNHL